MKTSDRWIGIAGILLGLLFGGAGASAIGYYQAGEVRKDLEAKLEKVEEKSEDRDATQAEALSKILVELAKVQTALDEVKERLDRRESPRRP